MSPAGEILDVVIVGAGLSGIGAACHLAARCPAKTFAIVESRHAIGGTWDLFRYPGIRSDSDMHTLGYAFAPWRARESIADGASIREYVRETAREHDIERHIRFGHRLRRARWSSDEACWLLEVEVAAVDPEGAPRVATLRARLLSMCSGYYRYDRGHAPHFEGVADFRGRIVHPQFWPEDLDPAGRRIAVIGSGATAITLLPALAKTAAHVTMIQRSPTWIASLPAVDRIAVWLRRLLPDALAYRLVRAKNVLVQRWIYRQTRVHPERVRAHLLREVRNQLGPDYDVEKHFTPSYNPWDQRLCLVPDADLFKAIRSGKAEVVTDEIERFTANGIALASGATIEADIIVTATGLELVVLGGASFSVDGRAVSFPETFSYKGMMFSEVPNLVYTLGYINASWTLRSELVAEYVCRLLNHMDARGVNSCLPRLRPDDLGMAKHTLIDDFSPGYMRRGMHLFPKQGDRDPWRNTQNYLLDRELIRKAPIEDGVLVFGTASGIAAPGTEATRSAA